MEGLSVADKNELLFQREINFNDLPSWQKRGIGFYLVNYDRDDAVRRKLKVNMELPIGDAYGKFIESFLL